MTRETKLLIDMWDILHRECHKVVTEENYDAIKKSIKALEQEPFINKPCVSSGVCEHDKNKVLEEIKKEIKALKRAYPVNYVSADDAVDTCLAIIDRYIGKESE